MKVDLINSVHWSKMVMILGRIGRVVKYINNFQIPHLSEGSPLLREEAYDMGRYHPSFGYREYLEEDMRNHSGETN